MNGCCVKGWDGRPETGDGRQGDREMDGIKKEGKNLALCRYAVILTCGRVSSAITFYANGRSGGSSGGSSGSSGSSGRNTSIYAR